jgi:rRNA maturation protein Nop10
VDVQYSACEPFGSGPSFRSTVRYGLPERCSSCGGRHRQNLLQRNSGVRLSW